MNRTLKGMLIAAMCLVTLGLTTTQSQANRNSTHLCRATEHGVTHLIVSCERRAANEFEKFKWDFKRQLEDLGEMAAQEDVDELVDRFCSKIEIRGELYQKRVAVKYIAAKVILITLQCPHGYFANVERRARAYFNLIDVAVWECCAEIEDMAADMMAP